MSERKAVVVYPESLRVEVMDWSVAAKKFPGKETKMEKLVRKIVTNDGVIVIDFTYIIKSVNMYQVGQYRIYCVRLLRIFLKDARVRQKCRSLQTSLSNGDTGFK